MQHFEHPDAEIWAGFFSASINGVLACFRQYTDASTDNKHDHDKAVELCSTYADKMLVQYRKRFPIPEQDLTAEPSSWDRRFGRFPADIFNPIPQQQFGRGLRFHGMEIYPDERLPDNQIRMYPANVGQLDTVDSSFELCRQAFIAQGKAIPQWIKDLVAAIDVSDSDKIAAFLSVAKLVRGQAINMDSGSLKGAFDWKDAQEGFKFWADIAFCLPPVVDHQPERPAKILPEDGQ